MATENLYELAEQCEDNAIALVQQLLDRRPVPDALERADMLLRVGERLREIGRVRYGIGEA